MADGERRADPATRDRLNEIEDNWQDAIKAVRKEYASLAQMLDRRYRRVVWMLIGTVGVLTLTVAVGFVAFRDVLREQDSQRRNAVVSACEERRHSSLAIRGFVASVSPELSDEVATGFPVEPDCEKYADRIMEGERR